MLEDWLMDIFQKSLEQITLNKSKIMKKKDLYIFIACMIVTCLLVAYAFEKGEALGRVLANVF